MESNDLHRFSVALDLPGMLSVSLILFAWQQFSAQLGCLASLLFIVPVWGAISLSLCEGALLRRRVFVNQYLEPGSLLARWLSRGLILLLWQGVKGMVLTIALFIALLTANQALWVLLLADIPVVLILTGVLTRVLHTQIKSQVLQPLVRVWVQPINSLLLWLLSVCLMLLSEREDFGAIAWSDAVGYSASQVAAQCDFFQVLGRAAAVWDTSAWWAAQHLMAGVEKPWLALVGWLSFLSMFAASLVTAWAFSRALLGVISKPWRI
ncbi:MAG: hypothetical protein KDI63_07770 [Gammaproteobacteria bacterium]|nr:hypothetical protein [Gammaproteobacteria bacterium]